MAKATVYILMAMTTMTRNVRKCHQRNQIRPERRQRPNLPMLRVTKEKLRQKDPNQAARKSKLQFSTAVFGLQSMMIRIGFRNCSALQGAIWLRCLPGTKRMAWVDMPEGNLPLKVR